MVVEPPSPRDFQRKPSSGPYMAPVDYNPTGPTLPVAGVDGGQPVW